MTNTLEFDKVAAWNIWCDHFLNARTDAMTDEQSKMFLTLMYLERDNESFPEAIKGEFLYQVASKRADHLGLTINPYALVLLCAVSGNVGNVVMYVTALTRYSHTSGKTITMLELANVFPIGFVTEAERSRIWDEQKGHYLGQKFDNLIDRVSKEDF